jgi:tetratricopeptide (TPR) repeat protein
MLSYLCLAGPALGLVTFYFQRYSFVADHFVYLPSLPILALYAGAGARLLERWPRRWPGVVVAAAAVVALGATTWRHALDYRDHQTLGRAIVRANPSSWLGHNLLGSEALRRRDFAAALGHLARAERIAPGRLETQLNLALARMNAGDLAGAEEAARRAVSIRDGAAIAHLVLGDALLRAGRFDEAVASYAAALDRGPRLRRARSGLGLAQSRAGRHEAAVATLAAALAEDPANVAARTGLAWSLAQLGRRDEAIAELERALALAPGDARLVRNLELLRAGGPR